MCDVYQCEIKLDVDLVVSQLVEKQEFEVVRKCADHYAGFDLTDVILQEVCRCGVWEGAVVWWEVWCGGRELWCVGGRCGVWERGVVCGREVWCVGGRCGV